MELSTSQVIKPLTCKKLNRAIIGKAIVKSDLLDSKGTAFANLSKKVLARAYVGVIYATDLPKMALVIISICESSDLPNRLPHIITLNLLELSRIPCWLICGAGSSRIIVWSYPE